ncbi:MAG: hypothetical protein IPJ74_26855 [Saprospiraceae bacterium]|nr:hypothetical protein [Saprospiraceae bacterium]
MLETLKDALWGWDERSTAYLLEIYHSFAYQTDFISNLISICYAEKGLQNQATWLLKHHTENKHPIAPHDTRNLIKLAEILEFWGAKLHLLQILPFLKLEENDLPYLDPFIKDSIKSTNKFVRAWAYNGLYEMSKVLPELREEVRLTYEQALEIEAPSVKARIKKVLQAFNK